jgi:hypothetical protein
MRLFMKLFCVLSAVLALTCQESAAQKYTISTDVLSCAAFGTLNVDASMALSRKWSLVAGLRYNPFTFNTNRPDKQFQLRQRSCSFGARFWPWHFGSGWWLAGKMRYQEYNMGGLLRGNTREGDRVGGGIYTGYTHMLSAHINLEFGLGVWAGVDVYTVYSCPLCGLTVDSGNKFFVLPDDIMISLAYVF